MNNPIIEAAVASSIRPEAVARKLAAIRKYQGPNRDALKQIEATPRIVELLWFVQGMSHKDGGLKKLAAEFLARFKDSVGTTGLLAIKTQDLTLKQKLAVFKELPERVAPAVPHPYREDEEIWITRDAERDFQFYMKTDPDFLKEATRHWNYDYFAVLCREAAAEGMPGYLAAICIDEAMSFDAPWFFPGAIQALIQFIDERAEEIKAGLVMTEVTSQILDALDYTYSMKKMIQIRGNSRFGKTQSLRAYCSMWPGRSRMVTVPPENSQRAFLLAIAEPLGMDTTYGSSVGTLEGRIRDVLNQSGLFLVFDEAAFLVPRSYSKNTPAYRMDWVRCELFDRGRPVALGVTPQWYDAEKDKDHPEGAFLRYARFTGYAKEQFEGRCQRLCLPEELGEADLLKLARFYFPEITRKADLLIVASYALTSENYLQAIQDIADRARYVAHRDGAEFGTGVVNAAIAWLFPEQSALPASTTISPPVEAECSDVSRGIKPIARGLQPAGIGGARGQLLASSVVRGAGTQNVEGELAPVEA